MAHSTIFIVTTEPLSISKEGHELGTLVDALGCIVPEGVGFHAKVGADGPKLVVGLQ